MNGLLRRPSLSVILFAGILCAMGLARYRLIGDDGQAWHQTVNSDGEGYYAYLTGAFLQGNPSKAPADSAHFTPAGTGRVIQYYCGTALLEAPFFLAAHAWSMASGDTDPMAKGFPYQFSIALASLFYLVLGLWLVRRLLIRLGITEKVIAFALLILIMGTGLPYYAIMIPGMSHVYGFAMVAWTLVEAQRAWAGRPLGIQRASAVLALTILVRPTHALLLLALPLVALADRRPLWPWVRERGLAKWLWAALTGVAILMLQPMVWHWQCGLWWVNSYAGEGFDWAHPHIWSVLFGARKGLFFYWPLLLLLFPGLALILGRRPFIGATTLLSLGLIIYVTSSWWSWYYGYGYGLRPLLDITPVFAVLIASGLSALRPPMRKAAFACTLPFMALQVFQSWQYVNGIIHPFNMDREKYGMIFLRTDDRWRNAFGWAYMAPPYAPNGMDVLFDGPVRDPANAAGPSGLEEIALGPQRRFSPPLVLKTPGLPPGAVLYVQASCRRKAARRGASDAAELVYSVGPRGKSRIYSEFPLNDIKDLDDRKWRHWRYAFIVPPAHNDEELAIYVWQPTDAKIILKDFRIKVSAVRPQ
jgi:hypothetical protein